MKQQDTYREAKTIHFQGGVARVHIPILTDAERERRMKIIAKAAREVLTAKST